MSAPFDPRPVTLTGEHVRLEPLGEQHADALFEAGRDPDVWTWLPADAPADRDAMAAFVADAVARTAAGEQIAFATVAQATGATIGSTRFLDLQPAHRALEIGWTWIGTPHQRTAANTEAKLLQLAHAFDDLGAVRVQLKTDLRNERSQRAMQRIGAVREGVLRHNIILPDGWLRDSVYYSILDDEWPEVRSRLEQMLGR